MSPRRKRLEVLRSFKQFIKRLLPSYAVFVLVLVVNFNFFVYLIGSQIGRTKILYDFSLPIDDKIPFMSWTVIIYLGCYLFWTINYVLSTNNSKKDACIFMVSEMLGKLVCFICYVFLPSTMIRATITGTGIFDKLIMLVYYIDYPVNLLPSLHCFASMMCYLGIKNNPNVPNWYKVFSLVFALLVCVSTLTTKQHVFLDTVTGVGLAMVCYYLTASIYNRYIEK